MTQPGVPSVPFDKLRLVQQVPAAELFSGVDEVGAAVTVVVLTPVGAADPAVRTAFERSVDAARYGPIGGPIEVQTADLTAAQPWAAAWTEPGVTGLLSALPEPTAGSGPAPGTPTSYEVTPPTGYQVSGGPVEGLPGSAPPWSTPAVMSGPPAGYPPPPAPPPVPPVPAVQESSRTGLVLILVGVIVAIVLVGSGILAAVLLTRPSPAPTPVAGSTTPATAATSYPAPTAAPTTGASTAAPDPGGTTKPTLRAVPAKTVVGPTFGATEQTYTMAFQGWPFAFRTPKTWGCMAGKVDKIPDAKAWVCIDEGNPSNKERANIMLRACQTTCTPAERTSMNNDWFDQPAKAKQAGDDHSYLVETPSNSKGLYSIDYSRFFGPPGQPLKWQVGVYVEAPSGTKGDVQKIVNDIASQTS